MQEQWTRWEPVEGLAKKYYIESISDTKEGVKIVFSELEDRKRQLHMLFKNSLYAYRYTGLCYMGPVLCNIDQEYGRSFYDARTFFEVENSEYMQWLSTESFGWSDMHLLEHITCVAVNGLVDIVTNYRPEIIILYLP
jgi:hypothetical protein